MPVHLINRDDQTMNIMNKIPTDCSCYGLPIVNDTKMSVPLQRVVINYSLPDKYDPLKFELLFSTKRN